MHADNSKVPSAYDYERFFLAGYWGDELSYNASVEKGKVRAYLFLHSGEEAVRRSVFQSLKTEPESIRHALLIIASPPRPQRTGWRSGFPSYSACVSRSCAACSRTLTRCREDWVVELGGLEPPAF